MKSKVFIIPLIVIQLLVLTSGIVLASDREGVTVASDWEDDWKDDADNFANLVDSVKDWDNAGWPHTPNATWWQEEPVGHDDQWADNVTLSLILSHSCGGSPVKMGFGPNGTTANASEVRLGYASSDNYGCSLWSFIIECDLFNDNDFTNWYDSMTGTHMLLGFKNSPAIQPGDLEQLAKHLTGLGDEPKNIANSFCDTFVTQEEPHDDNIVHILVQNTDVYEDDWLTFFNPYIEVDPSDRTHYIHWNNDTTPPAAITDLSVDTPKYHSLTLHWTTPGDNGSTGIASKYDIRYSTSTINEGNWSLASKVEDEPSPLTANSSQSMKVSGLSANTTYYFAMKTADGIPNWSSISNCANGTTTAGLGSWGNSIQIDVDHTQIDSDLTHFPLLIHLSDNCSQNSANMTKVFDEVGANRFKIAATKDDGTTQLYIEVEKWDNADKEAWLWVSKSGWQISSTEDTTLYLYYDNAQPDNTTYVGDTGSTAAKNVWDSSFKQVLHLSSNTLDSTSNNNYGIRQYGVTETADSGTTTSMIKEATNRALNYTNDYYNGWTCEILSGPAQGQIRTVTDYIVIDYVYNKQIYLDSPITGLASGATYILYVSGEYPAYIDGEVGGAVEFNGTDQWISATTLSGSEITGNTLTLEAIAKPDSLSGSNRLLQMVEPFNLYTSSDKLIFRISNGTWSNVNGNITLSTQLMYLAGVYDGTHMTTYVDGIFDDQIAKTGNMRTWSPHVGPYVIGLYMSYMPNSNACNYFNGEIDEIRITKGARSVAWIKATYYSCSDNLTYFEGGSGMSKMGGGKGIPDESSKISEDNNLPPVSDNVIPEVPMPSDNTTNELPYFNDNNTLEDFFLSDNITEEKLNISDNITP